MDGAWIRAPILGLYVGLDAVIRQSKRREDWAREGTEWVLTGVHSPSMGRYTLYNAL